MLADWELLKSVTFFVICKAYKTPNNAIVNEGLAISDHPHFDKVLGVDSLLDHIVDAILS